MARKILALLGAFATVATACNQYNGNMMMMNPYMMNMMNMMNMGGHSSCGCSNNMYNGNNGNWNNGQVWARVCTATAAWNEASMRNAIALHLGVSATTTAVAFGVPATANGQTCADVTVTGANQNQVASYCQTVTSALPQGLQGASILSVSCNTNNGNWNNGWNNNGCQMNNMYMNNMNMMGGCGCQGNMYNGNWNANGNFMSRICTAQNNWNAASLRTALAAQFLVPNSVNNVVFGAPATANGQTCADLTVVGSTDATRKSQMCAAPLPAGISNVGILTSTCNGNWNGNYNNGNCNNMHMNMNMGCQGNMMNGMMGGMMGMNPMMGGMGMMNPMMMGGMGMMNPMMMGGMGGMMNPMMMGGMGMMNPMMMGMNPMMGHGSCP